MTCKFPLLMYWNGEYTENGKKKLETWRKYDTAEEIRVPCGRCMACRINNGRLWSVRCMAESKEHKENYFLTLTIDPQYEWDTLGNVGHDNLVYPASVNMDDVSKFIKRLRADQYYHHKTQDKIRYLCSSEYGETTGRPHYHMILFGAHIDDMKYYGKSGSFPIYTSEYINEIWRLGTVFIGEVTPESSAYVAKYAVKDTGEYRDLCNTLKINYPSMRMSRRPGIGKHYFEVHRDEILKDRGLYLNGKLLPIPDSWTVNISNYDTDMAEYESYINSLGVKNQRYHYQAIDTVMDPAFRLRPLEDDIHKRNKV